MDTKTTQEKSEHCKRKGRPFLFGLDYGAKSAYITRPNCGLWSCSYCGREKAREWQSRIGWGAERLMARGDALFFVTLTAMGWMSPRKTLENWRGNWPKLSSRLRRAAKERCEYAYVHEKHKDGRLHTHFVTNADLGRRWWKDKPHSCGFGYMNDVREVESAAGVANYVSKYLVKSLGGKWPKGWRRLSVSRSWPMPDVGELEDDRQWIVAKKALDLRIEYESISGQGFSVDVDADVFGDFYRLLEQAGLELSDEELDQLVP